MKGSSWIQSVCTAIAPAATEARRLSAVAPSWFVQSTESSRRGSCAWRNARSRPNPPVVSTTALFALMATGVPLSTSLPLGLSCTIAPITRPFASFTSSVSMRFVSTSTPSPFSFSAKGPVTFAPPPSPCAMERMTVWPPYG